MYVAEVFSLLSFLRRKNAAHDVITLSTWLCVLSFLTSETTDRFLWNSVQNYASGGHSNIARSNFTYARHIATLGSCLKRSEATKPKPNSITFRQPLELRHVQCDTVHCDWWQTALFDVTVYDRLRHKQNLCLSCKSFANKIN